VAKSAEKFKTDAGGQYGIAFMRSTGTVLVPATQACKTGEFPVGATYDVVFIISASGHIERVLDGPGSAYSECIASHLRQLHSAPKPPSAPWQVHVRFLHGRQPTKGPQPSFMVYADDAGMRSQ
jgi:hypothetical protein